MVPHSGVVAAVVLAAGQSRRMGRPKALLPTASGETFVARALRAFTDAGLAHVAVVGRRDDERLCEAVGATDSRVAYLCNTHPESGQLSSVLVGISYALRVQAGALMVLPVDMPYVRVSTVAALLSAWERGGFAIVRPEHRGRHGHPVLFSSSLFDELLQADPGAGARAVVRADPARVLDVEVDDPGVIHDIDDPREYRRSLVDHPG